MMEEASSHLVKQVSQKAVAERLRHRSREHRVPSSSPAWTSVLR